MNKKIIKQILSGLLLATLIVVIVYTTFITNKVVSGVSVMVDTPKHMMQLQILDASGGKVKNITATVKKQAGKDLLVQVIGVDKFELQDLPHSMIISHEKEDTTAKLLASKLGIDHSQILYKPISHNIKQATATLVVALDFDTLISLVNHNMEN